MFLVGILDLAVLQHVSPQYPHTWTCVGQWSANGAQLYNQCLGPGRGRTERAGVLEIRGCCVSHSESWDWWGGISLRGGDRGRVELHVLDLEGHQDQLIHRFIVNRCGSLLSLQLSLLFESSATCWSLPSVGHCYFRQPQRWPLRLLSASPGFPKRNFNPAPKATEVSRIHERSQPSLIWPWQEHKV